MGTYDSSRFVTTRKPHNCDKCGKPVQVGTEALAYKLGLKWTAYVHADCALQENSGYYCAAVNERRLSVV